MATVSVIVPTYDPKTGRPKMVIKGSNGDAYIVPWAPRNVAHEGLGENVTEIERPGRVAEIAVTSPMLHKMSFSFTIGRDIAVSCQGDLDRLEAIVNTGGWIMILYGPRESGLWKCTNFTWSSVEREPMQNQVSRAEVYMNFTEIPDSRKVVAQYSDWFNFRDDNETANINSQLVANSRSQRGRATSLMTATPAYIPPAAVQTPNRATQQPYVVQEGDTLNSIANKLYGQYGEQFWRVLGDINGLLGNPQVGQVLKVP